MTYIKFHNVDDGDARAELIEAMHGSYYEDVHIIGKTDKNFLVGGVAFVNEDNEIVFHHENDHEFGDIIEWTFAENPTGTTEITEPAK